MHPAAADALIDEEDFDRGERLPYWADLWPSAIALARFISAHDLAGKTAIELGCGVGLPTILALERGAEVLATDHYEAPLDFARYNAGVNGIREPRTALLDWHEPGGVVGSFDLVLAADVLYERRNVPSLVTLIPRLLAPDGEVLLADPRRKDEPAFIEEMELRGFRSSTRSAVVEQGDREVKVLVHSIRRCYRGSREPGG